MLKFIARRLGISFLILLGGSLLMFVLTINSGDPIADLRESRDPNKENLIAMRTEAMGLDLPWYERYWNWLRGVLGYIPGLNRLEFIGEGTLGRNRSGAYVSALLANAASSTLRLVLIATLLAIVIGIGLGIVTAVRQYSGFDYGVTFLAFVFFSLPVFWAAVLLKQYAAIAFNNWLAEPTMSWATILGIAVTVGFILQLAMGGSWKRRLYSFVASAAVVAAALFYFDTVNWFRMPSVGLPVFILSAIGAGALVVAMSSGFGNKRVVRAVATTVIAGSVIYGVLRGQLLTNPSWPFIIGCLLLSVAVAVVAGLGLGGFSRKVATQMSIVTALIMSLIAFADLMMTNWASYLTIQPRPIATIGSVTPNLNGDFWQTVIDQATHMILPTIVLTIISIAGYIRYTRASMLEVLNQDYIRTARSKGLSERKVITKHAFRNALIPLTTIVAFDFAGLIGGAVITETVFGWKGMGDLFRVGLEQVDPAPVMAFFLVTGTAAVVMNMLADIAYAFLDPRITR